MPMFFARPQLSDLLLAAAYFAAASLMLSLTRFDGGVAFLWLAGALLIPVLAGRPRREWGTPMALCGAASAIATGLVGLGWALALPLAMINLVEAYVGASLLVRYRATRARTRGVRRRSPASRGRQPGAVSRHEPDAHQPALADRDGLAVERRRRSGESFIKRSGLLIQQHRECTHQLHFLLLQLRNARSRVGKSGALSGEVQFIDDAAFDGLIPGHEMEVDGSGKVPRAVV